MSDELVVNPAALQKFSADMQPHLEAVSTAFFGLQSLQQSGMSGTLFGDFADAADLNARTSQLLNETAAQLKVAVQALAALLYAAGNSASLFHANEQDTTANLATINRYLDTVESQKYGVKPL